MTADLDHGTQVRSMQLAFAMLADFAEAAPDGKLTIGGGDFDTVFAPAFPAVHARTVALLIRGILESEDIGRQHVLRVEFRGPDGELVIPPFEGPFMPEAGQRVTEAPEKLAFVLNFPVLVFQAAGRHEFRIYVDDAVEPLAILPLYAIQRNTSPTPPEAGTQGQEVAS